MPELILRPRARRDLQGIWSYTEKKWSHDQANRYVAVLGEALADLRDGRAMGRACDEISAGLHKRVCQRHVIFFRIQPDRLLVVRILHQSMDFRKHV